MNPKIIALLEQGYALQQQGKLHAAEKNYRQVLRLDRTNEFALNLLGVVCIRTSRPAEALQLLETALGVNARDAETHNNLGLACTELKQFPKARAAFERSLKLNRQQPATWNNLGNVLAATDQHDQAIRCFESALSLDGRYVDCLNNLSVSLKEVGRLEHALQVIDRAIQLEPGRSMSHNNKGEILLRATQYEQADAAFEQAIRLDGSVVARINHSTALKQLGRDQAAVQVLKDVLAQEKDNSEALNHLGVLYEQLGDMEKAAECFRLALKYTPDHASSFYQLSKLKNQRLTEQEFGKVNSLLEAPQLLDIFRSSLYFALACEYEKRKDYESSFENLLKGQNIKANRQPYNQSAPLEYLEAVKPIFPIELKIDVSPRDDRPTPVFVVGMPRSGTTLTEQILSSHSAITGAGEIGFISEAVKQASTMTRKPFPECVKALSREQVLQLRTGYLQRMVQRFGHNRFLVDKNPLNFNLLGVIATIFPEAKIIYCKRNPMDNCLSIFRLPFDDNQGYSHDLAALGHYYRQHENLVAFWMSCYPGRIMTVHYEDTVQQLEQQARRMLDFIGVGFEEQVLSFFDNERIVMTPSAEQVRQPIYTDRVDAWKKFEKHLGPLIEALEYET
ncbi:MAG: sulfotransferase [Xanthomonadales bacterium]|nr:sulfotransferase [Xanthomonadales bacterium]